MVRRRQRPNSRRRQQNRSRGARGATVCDLVTMHAAACATGGWMPLRRRRMFADVWGWGHCWNLTIQKRAASQPVPLCAQCTAQPPCSTMPSTNTPLPCNPLQPRRSAYSTGCAVVHPRCGRSRGEGAMDQADGGANHSHDHDSATAAASCRTHKRVARILPPKKAGRRPVSQQPGTAASAGSLHCGSRCRKCCSDSSGGVAHIAWRAARSRGHPEACFGLAPWHRPMTQWDAHVLNIVHQCEQQRCGIHVMSAQHSQPAF